MKTKPEVVVRPVPCQVIRQIEETEPEADIDRLPCGWLSSEIEDIPVIADVHVFHDWPNIYAVFLLGCGHFSSLVWFRPKTVFDMRAVLKPFIEGGWPFGCRECRREKDA